MNIDRSINRIVGVIDKNVNTLYDYQEPSLSIVTKTYIKKYIELTGDTSQLIILCTTSYLVAMKYLLDSAPRMRDYSELVKIPIKKLVNKEMLIGKSFMFNFTPKK